MAKGACFRCSQMAAVLDCFKCLNCQLAQNDVKSDDDDEPVEDAYEQASCSKEYEGSDWEE